MSDKKYLIEKQNFTTPNEHTFSSGEYYEILLISKGTCQFALDNTLIYCNTENAIFMKPNQSVVMHYTSSKYPLEIFSIRILPSYLISLSDETCDLEKSFSFVPRSISIIHLDARDTTLIKNMAKTIRRIAEESDTFGRDLYIKNMESILTILFLRSCIASDHVAISRRKKQLVMDDIFLYIREHLTGDLSLETLEKKFFVSRHHLCREFKKLTGQTIHSYIVKSRLDLCKKYIEMGKPIKEVYELGGFGSYNHFFRAFKNEYSMTPKEYYESLTE